MAVLIVTHRYDLHAWALRWGLREVGVETDVLITRDFPEGNLMTLCISTEAGPEVYGQDLRSLPDYSSVWLRHIESPNRVSKRLSGCDHDVVIDQTKDFVDNIMRHIGNRPNVINRIDTRSAALSKFHQLSIARDVGFAIPDTIVTNDPTRIRSLAARHGGKIIYKPFQPPTFIIIGDDEIRVERTYTSLVTAETLDAPDAAFTSAPGIYQQFISKIAELRVTFFGDMYIAARIFSQEDSKTLIDSRVNPSPRMEVAGLDEVCLERCRKFTRRLGLMSGTLDLVETPGGGIAFLEVNERAQYLFVEEILPELKLLSIAVAFAQNPSSEFRIQAAAVDPSITYARFLQSSDYTEFLAAWDEHRNNDLIPYSYFVRDERFR